METVLIKTFNRVLESGELPKQMQIARLIPIFKKGDRDACENYRPIAITDFIYINSLPISFNTDCSPNLNPFYQTSSAVFDLREAQETPSSPFNASQRNAGVRGKRFMLPFSISNKPMNLSHRKPC